MKAPSWRIWLLSPALLALAAAAQWGLIRLRSGTEGPAIAESAFSAFGGFRSLAAEIVWFRADRLQEEGRYVELAELAHALALSEPHTPEVWSYSAWNLAYNVSVMMPEYADRWRWVYAALKLLRDDGLQYNPRSAELYREIAWLFQLKIGLNIDCAAPLYRERWRKIVEDVGKRGAWEELKMDPSKIARFEMLSGFTDRGDAMYSAAYWAWAGREFADSREIGFLNEILRQSIRLYQKNHAEKNG